jgi:hypothetical protein
MESNTGDVWLKMMTAADLALPTLVRKIRLLIPLIMSARDFWKVVVAGPLFQLLHASIEWASFDKRLWLLRRLLRSAVWRPFPPHIPCVVIRSDIESHG